MSETPDKRAAPPTPVGVEVADAGVRLTALVGSDSSGRRFQERRSSPIQATEAHSVIADFALRSLIEAGLLDDKERVDHLPHVSLCVAIAGRVGGASVVLQAQGLPEWANLPLGKLLSQRVARARVESAVQAAALAEATIGAGNGSSSVLYVAIGRRISSALVVGGEIWHGAHDGAGQLGHWRVAAQGPRCVCGAQGHLDPLASAQSIVRNMIGLASDSDESHSAMLRVTHGRAEAMGAAQVMRLAIEGDRAAESVMSAAIDGLSDALANLVAILDPEIIVLEAPFGAETEAVIAALRERVNTLTATFAEPATIVASGLGPLATLEGARLLAGHPGGER